MGGGLLSRPVYGAQKAGADKMAADMAKELRPHNVAAVSIWMAGTRYRTRPFVHRQLAARSQTDGQAGITAVHGRVIAALYASGDLMHYSGRALIGAELALSSASPDIDGSTPLSLRYTLGGQPELHASLR